MNREILRLAIPNILSNLTVPLLGAVDLALAGHMPGEDYIGAIGLGGLVFSYLYWAFGFLRMGSTGLTAQAYGASDQRGMTLVLQRGLTVAMVGGLLLVLLQIPLEWLSLQALSASQGVELLVSEYFRYRIWAAPASLGLFALSGWFLGMQNALYPMLMAIIANGANIMLSIFFVHNQDMQVDGIALGTTIAQWLGFLFGMGVLLTRYRGIVRPLPLANVLHLPELKAFFAVNGDIFVRTMALLTIFAIFNDVSAKMGDVYLGVNVILLQLINIQAYGVDGFAFAVESLAGRYFGARDEARFRKAVKLCLYWGFGLSIIYVGVFAVFEGSIMRLFTNQTSILYLYDAFYPLMLVYLLLAPFAFIWDGIMIGITAGKIMRWTMLDVLVVVFIPAVLWLTPYWANFGLWGAMLLAVLGRWVLMMLMGRLHIRSIDWSENQD